VLPLLLLRLVELLLPFLVSRLVLVLQELAQQEPALLLVFSKELVLRVLALLLEPSKEPASLPRVARPVLALDSLPLAPLLELVRPLATVLLVTLVPTLALLPTLVLLALLVLLPTLALPPALPTELLAMERPQAARASLLLTPTPRLLTPRRRTRSILWRVVYWHTHLRNAGCEELRLLYRNKAFGLAV
jgi:hypothetical protein